jgi:diadenosine tetraphosphate (Ap4A) HIT family hydrolase
MTLAVACPFCEIAHIASHPRIVVQNEHAFLIHDAYPVSNGHSLVILKNHIGSFFETNESERLALFQLVNTSKTLIEKKFQPSAFNIGINDGTTAGQTVPHLHIHVIPRYKNDVPDPRGGVRWVVPQRADYWSGL